LAVPLSRMEVRDGRYRLPAATLTELEIARSDLHGLLRERLALTPHKDVYLYVHGFRSRFQDAVFGIAQVWHFMGRPGVPVAYTWPAGHGGIAGYAYDRESGEFTVYHLKKFILAVVACPEVRRLHLIAHSRGTDVVCTALRELNIEFKAKGLDTAEELKLENLVLAAPDLDTDVFEQRFGIEDLHRAARRTTVYLSRADFALKTANWLFSGQRRLGNLSMEDLVPESRCKLTQLPSLHLVNCNVTGYSSSHNYVFKHPAAFSDLILVLRDRRDPGATCGRPLGTPVEGIWLIDNDYLLSPQPSGTPEGVLQRQ